MLSPQYYCCGSSSWDLHISTINLNEVNLVTHWHEKSEVTEKNSALCKATAGFTTVHPSEPALIPH